MDTTPEHRDRSAGAPVPGGKEARHWKLHRDSVLILISLALLLLLGWSTDRPFFEALRGSRLAYLTTLMLPLFVGYAVLRQRFSRLSTVLRDWWPVLGVLLVYENLKHMHANQITEFLGIAPKDMAMLAADVRLFGKALPLHFDNAVFAAPWFTHVMWFFYVWVYYLGPVALLGWAYFLKEQDDLFLRLRQNLVYGLLGGYVLYLLVPVEGPLYHLGEQFTRPILTQPVIQRYAFSALRYNWDCFPSLHTAIPWLLTMVAWKALPRGGRVAAVIGASGVTLSTVVLRFHYGIDLVAGIAWALLVAWALRRVPAFSRAVQVRLPAAVVSMDPAGTGLRGRVRFLGLLFVLTGGVGLLAEQAFEKILSTLLGASTPAAATVLAVYFLGLTLGGLAYGSRVRKRVGNPLRAYACMEGGVAVWSLLLCVAFPFLISAFAPVLSFARDSFWTLQGLRFLVAGLWILPPTFLMGLTFPAVVDALETMRIPQPRRAMARFYALNLLGAILGAVAGPYLAFPRWGVDGTLLAVFAVDLVVALTAFRLAEGLRGRRPAAAEPGPEPGAESQAGAAPEPVAGPARWDRARLMLKSLAAGGMPSLLAVGFLSGFLFFSLEVVWTHLISGVLGNSIYAFAAMLALVLVGLGIGGFAASAMFRRRQTVPAWAVAGIFLMGGLVLNWQFGRWPQVPGQFSLWGANLYTFAQGETLRWIQAGIQLLPASAVLGIVYPCLFRLDVFPARDRAASAGRLSAANSLGCILGALATGFGLLPSLGSEATLQLLILTCFLCAFLLGWTFLKRPLRSVLAWTSVAAAVACFSLQEPWDRLALTSGEHVYSARNQVFKESRLVFWHEDTHGGITTVVHNPAGVRGQDRPYKTLLTNGKFQGNDSWEIEAQTGVALVPILHARNFDRAMVIGLGTGHSATVVDGFGFKEIEIAEIAPGIVEAARRHFAHINGRILEKSHVKLALEDGRNRLLLDPSTYDLVTMEISSVWFAGSTNLYSQEFYRLVKQRLRPGGVFQQWIQIHHISPIEVGSVIRTLRSVFPHVSFWVVGGQGILLASEEPQMLRAEAMRRYFQAAPSLGIGAASPEDFLKQALSSRLLSEEDVTRLCQEAQLPINTDANRYLEYHTPRYNLGRANFPAINLRTLADFASFTPYSLEAEAPPQARSVIGAVDRAAHLKTLRLTQGPPSGTGGGPAPKPEAGAAAHAQGGP